MKVTLNWLKQYVDFDWSPEELADRLTMLGLEVEGIHKVAGEFEGIVVAEVLTRDKHPNADKLSLCRVNDGRGVRQIVCGAQNFQAGDKVPLILPGASLPAKPGEPPLTIKVGKIRGVESHGMLCSPKELGLAAEADGLLILPADAKVGQPFAEHLGRAAGDVTLDLEITPNRPDLNSHLGIAREIGAITGQPVRLPALASGWEDDSPAATDLAAVRLDDVELCPRYVARVIRGVKIGPSPDWLRQRLEAVGLRSINNVVDVTNFVMLETGQPLHAFDLRLLARNNAGLPEIIVRRANPGERFVTLDGQQHTLNGEMLLIADPVKAVALAGVMGGQNSEINQSTTDVLLESAYFQPASIRRTSKALGLRTDASYRFERGADIGQTDWASARAAQLIVETSGGRAAKGAVDAYPQPVTPRTITLRPEKAAALLGIPLDRPACESLLGCLGLKTVNRVPQPVDAPPAPSPLAVRIPSFRVDLKREVDLIEEIARLYGVDKIPATPPRVALGANPFDRLHDQIAEVRRILSGLGLDEAQGQTLVPGGECHDQPQETLVRLANPLSSDMNTLRPTLLTGLLHSLRHNLRHKNDNVALFEIGRVFRQMEGRLVEERRVALALTGNRHPAFWSGGERDAKADLHDLKGILEEFLAQLGLRPLTFAKRVQPTGLLLESAEIRLAGKLVLGEFGLLLPALLRRYDLRDAVVLAELRLDELLARRNPVKSFKPLPAFPAVRRDLALLVEEPVTFEAILASARQAKPAHLENIELFDVFRGRHVPPGQKSMACAFTYRHPDRTLTDTEVNAAHAQLVEHLKKALPAVVRE